MPSPQIFDSVQLIKPTKNTFNKSHSLLTTTEFGKLQPIMVLDCIPGDEVKLKHEFAIKVAPLIGPIMSEVDVKMFTFKIPYRIVWSDFEDFITKGPEGKLEINRPKIDLTGPTLPSEYQYLIKAGSLADALEFPTLEGYNLAPGQVPSCVFDQIPFRAVWKVFNDYFRDQNLEEEFNFPTNSVDMKIGAGASMDDVVQFMQMPHIAWRKDYFTSALPWTQRGPIAKIPIEINEVDILQRVEGADFRTNGLPWESLVYNQTIKGAHAVPNDTSTTGTFYSANAQGSAQVRLNTSNLYGYAENVQGTINDLRAMYAIQRWYERSALGGNRYIEQINAHFGVKSSDGRLQRPEFLGMSSTPLVINEVLQQSQTTSSSPLGQPAGHAFAYNKGDFMRTFCEEHCLIITFMAIVPQAVYYQGMPRKYMRDTPEEFFWPEFAHLGEDSVYRGELYYQFAGGNRKANEQMNKGNFGYQSRYADYKFSLNRISGDFKREPLNHWHLARLFGQTPVLNSNFIRVDSNRDDLNRVFAYEDSDFDHFWCNIYNHVYVKSPIPVFSTPI